MCFFCAAFIIHSNGIESNKVNKSWLLIHPNGCFESSKDLWTFLIKQALQSVTRKLLDLCPVVCICFHRTSTIQLLKWRSFLFTVEQKLLWSYSTASRPLCGKKSDNVRDFCRKASLMLCFFLYFFFVLWALENLIFEIGLVENAIYHWVGVCHVISCICLCLMYEPDTWYSIDCIPE